jgi:NSS family neurotransmitter:Na+ symporter
MAFVMAAIGSAVGLGNVWRFPYIAYKNGGGAFLIPYFVALFTAGIPMLILEFALGHWSRSGPPEAYRKIGRKWEWTGWWSSLVPFVITAYYVVIMAWCFAYMIYAIDLRWGTTAESFFLKTFLGVTSGPLIIGGIQIPALLALIIMWVSIFLILYKGIARIGKVVLISVPVAWILFVILAIRGVTLPGAMTGISYYLEPEFSRLLDVNVWLAAYGQIFFSLSLAQGIMISYASYLHKKSDLSNNAVITALADTGTSFLAGFAVFSVVGYLAIMQGVSIDQLQITGPALTFITYPTAISLFPVAASLFGILFYLALFTFGLDSAFSMIEPITSGIESKWRFTKGKATGIICLLGFLASLIFITGGGLYWLEIVDQFISNFGLVLVGLAECLIIGWVFHLPRLREHANKTSDIKIGRWWDILIKYVIPIVLTTLLLIALYDLLTSPQKYPLSALLVGGVAPCVIVFLLAFFFVRMQGKKGGHQ